MKVKSEIFQSITTRAREERTSVDFPVSKLTDKEIRNALVASLGRRLNAPRATLEEVHVCNGSAIADVVAVYKTMHCYEIKGETDSISRIAKQSRFYDQAFSLISLVTTKNHLNRAIQISPKHWGIIVASESKKSGVILRHVRGANRNPQYSPEVALLSLWRSELMQFPAAGKSNFEKMNRQKMAEAIAGSAPKKLINESLGNALATRRGRLAKQDSLVPCT